MTDKTALAERYAQMHNKGVQLYKSREVKFFTGFGPELHYNLIVAAMLGATGGGRLGARFESFLAYLKDLSSSASLLLVGRDFPVHLTVQQVVGNGVLPNVLVPAIAYGPIAFDTVIIDPAGNILLTATEVPDWLRSARAEIVSTVREAGYKPADLSIVHMTAARLKAVSDATFYNDCIDVVHMWNREFGNAPLELPTKAVFVGSTAALLGIA